MLRRACVEGAALPSRRWTLAANLTVLDVAMPEFLYRIAIIAVVDLVAIGVVLKVFRLRGVVPIFAGIVIGSAGGSAINSVVFQDSTPLAAVLSFVTTVAVLALIAYIAWRLSRRGPNRT